MLYVTIGEGVTENDLSAAVDTTDAIVSIDYYRTDDAIQCGVVSELPVPETRLVDELGTEADVKNKIGDLIDADVETQEFEPDQSIAERLGLGAERVAFAAGNGVANVAVSDGRDIEIELRWASNRSSLTS